MSAQRLYIDMDGTLVDFEAGIPLVSEHQKEEYGDDFDDIPGFFDDLPPVEGAVSAYRTLANAYDTYILSTAPWNNETAWAAKNLWVRRYLPKSAHKRLILTHHKHLVFGDILIDDRKAHGVDKFDGEHIHFGTERFPDWPSVLEYLL
ncbi:hypothetical protein ACG2F4_00810 [Halalkalibaculum sp. DA3122]|uniref:5' nucleotidase, NT5C type n=1 Tax=unclassified Halalkalibaculum TaxID=2964617 RepID=UPI0037543F5B